jgi:MFS family permease
MEGAKGVVTNGRDVRPGLSRRSSLLYVLSVVAGNRDLRRVELAFAASRCGELSIWLAMLVYAYAQGGVTESGVVATVLLIPAAAFPPVMGVIGERFALGTVLLAGYVAQAATCAAVAVALALNAHPLIVYALIVGPSVTFTMTRPTQSTFAPALARSPEELTATNVVSGWIESLSMLAAPALTGVVLALGSPRRCLPSLPWAVSSEQVSCRPSGEPAGWGSREQTTWRMKLSRGRSPLCDGIRRPECSCFS